LDSDQDQLEHLVDFKIILHRKTAAEHLVLFCGALEVQLYPYRISKPTGPPYAVCTHAPVFVARGLFHPSQVIVPHEFGVPGWEVVPVATGIEEGALSGVSSSVSFLDKEALENINKQFKTNLHKDAPFDFDTILAHGDLIVLEDDISDQVPAHTVAHRFPVT
jgi:hypothetical protein